jgi:hypothetical protein
LKEHKILTENKNVKRFSTSFVIRETQLKHRKYNLKSKTKNYCSPGETMMLFHTFGEDVNWYGHLEKTI